MEQASPQMNPQKRYEYTKRLKTCGLPFPTTMLTYTPKISSVAFIFMYKELTGDQSAAINIDQPKIEKRVKILIDMEDVDTIVDWRHLNSGHKNIYDVFW